ncbi:HAD-IIIA family hydrolase [Candidatus Daviesbacteria bacterium]|nr:HAD-IIIA family hydrolase [Candidatus Daviesbacteria bacterium]
MKKALFLDRDGVINQMISYKGEFDSPKKVSDVKLVEGVAEVISWLNKKNIPVIEVTNQPGVALGKVNWKTLEAIEKSIHNLLVKDGVRINKVYRCFHHPKAILLDFKLECNCRKPKTGMLIQAAKDLEIKLSESVLFGDNATDIEAGKRVGCKTILFLHTNDTPEKIAAKQNAEPDFKVYSHKEALTILKKLLK